MLEALLSETIFGFFLVFARIGSALMVVPVFGEMAIPQRVRLTIALAVTLTMYPLLSAGLPARPETTFGLAALFAGEMVFGLVVGGAARIVMSALHVAGMIISFQSTLAFAQSIDPTTQSQGTVIIAVINILGLLLIFASGLHYMILDALFGSYRLFPPGMSPDFGAFAELVTNYVAQAFLLGAQMATPFIVYGMVFYISLGLMGRLMPKIQLFFIAMPLQILLSFGLMMATLPVIMLWFLEHFEATLSSFLMPS